MRLGNTGYGRIKIISVFFPDQLLDDDAHLLFFGAMAHPL